MTYSYWSLYYEMSRAIIVVAARIQFQSWPFFLNISFKKSILKYKLIVIWVSSMAMLIEFSSEVAVTANRTKYVQRVS